MRFSSTGRKAGVSGWKCLQKVYQKQSVYRSCDTGLRMKSRNTLDCLPRSVVMATYSRMSRGYTLNGCRVTDVGVVVTAVVVRW
jgi:hypothetical protein